MKFFFASLFILLSSTFQVALAETTETEPHFTDHETSIILSDTLFDTLNSQIELYAEGELELVIADRLKSRILASKANSIQAMKPRMSLQGDANTNQNPDVLEPYDYEKMLSADNFKEELDLMHATVSEVAAQFMLLVSRGAKKSARLGGNAVKICSAAKGCQFVSRFALGAAILMSIYAGSVAGEALHELDRKYNDGAFYGSVVDAMVYVEELF